MKYFTALVNKKSEDGSHHITKIQFLAKRHRVQSDKWEYKVLIGYSMALNDVSNKPKHFINNMDWREAIHYAFEKELGWMKNIELEFLGEVTF